MDAWELTPRQTESQMAAEHPPLLVDCRELNEWQFCRLEGAQLVPLSNFAALAEELEIPASGAIVYCHHGVRSLAAVRYLRELGYENSFSMAGGIDRWSQDVDPEIPVY